MRETDQKIPLFNKKATFNYAVAGLLSVVLIASASDAKTTVKTNSQNASELTGVWLDHTKRGAVEILPCGELSAIRNAAKAKTKKTSRKRKISKTALCGRIVWLKDPLDKKGRPLTDQLNVKRSRRKRKICGLKIIGNVKRMSKRVYDKGWIYAPEKGKSFDVELRLKSNNILQVKGYLGIKALNETYLWQRLPSKPKYCTS